MTKPEDCTALVAKAVEEFGGVDVLVNNAGLGTAYPATRETPEQFRQVIDVNLMGAYWMAQAFGRAVTRGGSIVNIGSVLGLRPGTLPQAAYASSKAGLIGLTRDLAAQWTGRKGVRVNCLAPGFFPSEMSDELPAAEEEMVKLLAPAGRVGHPGRARRRAGLPRLGRLVVHHRRDAAGRRRPDDAVAAGAVASAAPSVQHLTPPPALSSSDRSTPTGVKPRSRSCAARLVAAEARTTLRPVGHGVEAQARSASSSVASRGVREHPPRAPRGCRR